ncbi:MAG: hypothetical protein OEZ06_28600 [Myxococcales bacterium]|nr:hypothetical protein [Myxococcales bacterium]
MAILQACSAEGDTKRTPTSGGAPGTTLGDDDPNGPVASDIPGGRQAQQPDAPTGSAGAASLESGEVDPDECSSVSQTAEVELGPADIVWVIDGSVSMLDEIAAVQMNIANFASDISSAGIDHHVVMVANTDIAMPTPLGGDSAHYRWVLANVDSHNALQVLLDTYPQYADFMRPDASLHFIVVTDDNAFTPHMQFKSQMEGLAGKEFYFHSIASEDAPGGCIGACGLPVICGAFAPGFEYYALSDLTGGEKISICVADWSQVFGPLKQAVIASAPLPCDYPIPPPPSGETLDPALVNMEFTVQDATDAMVVPRAGDDGECAANVAWFYDDPTTPTEIRLCPAACELAKAGGTVEIAFGCETALLVVD